MGKYLKKKFLLNIFSICNYNFIWFLGLLYLKPVDTFVLNTDKCNINRQNYWADKLALLAKLQNNVPI